MSYDLIAKSVDDARPVELFHISYSGSNWYYTSADRPLVLNGVTYAPVVVQRDATQEVSDVFKNGLGVRFARGTPFLEIFRVAPPSEIVTLTCYGSNYLVDNEFIVFWKGRIINVDWNETTGMAELTTESVYSSLQQAGLRRRFSRNCVHALYGPGCYVSRENYREDTQLTGVTGLIITAAAAIGKEPNYYAGGLVTWENAVRGNVEKRMIRQSFSDGRLVLSNLPLSLGGDAMVSIYPGCDHRIATCATKFNNEENYGGQPYIPGNNPFSGSSLY